MGRRTYKIIIKITSVAIIVTEVIFVEDFMTNIFVTGPMNDNEIGYLIKSRLSKSYTISYIKEDSFYKIGNGYDLVVFESKSPVINTDSGIILLKENGIIPDNISSNITAIINADNEEQLKAVQRNHIRVITCGTCNTATVSFTSETEDSIMISLNRALTALSGKEIEPLEIPTEKGGASRYSLMSYIALRLLLDDYNSELGKLI